MSKWNFFVLPLFLTLFSSAFSANIERNMMNTEASVAPSGSRPSAPEVSPIEYNGIRYEQAGHEKGEAPGGFLLAKEAASNVVLWRIRIYSYPDYSADGLPSIGRFFREMKMTPDFSAVDIIDEVGGHYRFDLETKIVEKIGGPSDIAPAKPTIVMPPPRQPLVQPEQKSKKKWYQLF